MKIYWIILAFAFGNSEKLDRTYLPPPGSKFAGGSPGAIDVPFNIPKDVKDSNLKSSIYNGGELEGVKAIPALNSDTSSIRKLVDSTNFQKIYDHSPIPIINTYQEKINKMTEEVMTESVPTDFKKVSTTNFDNSSGAPLKSGFHYLSVINPEKTDFGLYNEKRRPNIENNDSIKYLQENNLNLGSYTRMDDSEINHKDDMDLLRSNLVNINHHASMPLQSQIESLQNLPTEEDYVDNELTQSPLNQFATEAAHNLFTTKNMFDSTPIQSEVVIMGSNEEELSEFPTQVVLNDSLKSSRLRRPQGKRDRIASILSYKNIMTPSGFTYNYDTSNEIHVDVNGTATNGVIIQGSYSYIGDDGKVYNVTYTADENGFRPHGDHLPTSPPIPEAILKVIEQATKDKDAGIFNDGSYDVNKYGHKNYQNVQSRNKSSNESKFIVNGADISEKEFLSNHISKKEQKLRPQTYVLTGDIPNGISTNSKEYSTKGTLNRKTSNIFSKVSSDEINNGVTRKMFTDGNVPISEGHVIQQGLHTHPKHLLRSQVVIDPVPKKIPLPQNNMDSIEMKHINANNMTIPIPSLKHQHKVIGSSPKSTLVENGYMYEKPEKKNDFIKTENRFSEYDDKENSFTQRKNKDGKPKPFITPNVSRDYESGSEEDNAGPLDQSISKFNSQTRDESTYKLNPNDYYVDSDYNYLDSDTPTYNEDIDATESDIESSSISPQHKEFEAVTKISRPLSENSSQYNTNIDDEQNFVKITPASTIKLNSTRPNNYVIVQEVTGPESSSRTSEFLSGFESPTTDATYSIGTRYLKTNKPDEFLGRKLPLMPNDGELNSSILGSTIYPETRKGELNDDFQISKYKQYSTVGRDSHFGENSLDESSTKSTVTKQTSFDGTDSSHDYMIAIQKYYPSVTNLETHDSSTRESFPLYQNYMQTSTDEIIGEDFSGPKQIPKFDPISGYYY